MNLVDRPHCSGCVLQPLGSGFMPEATGSGRNGVLLVGEALGKDESAAGKPFVGQAGKTLDKCLMRAKLNRDDFKIANVVWCQPPQNKLSGMWYMAEAIEQCSPYLDAVIADMQPRVVVALGAVALRRLVPDCPVGILEARGYFHWSDRYKCWVTATVHPSFIMRGKTAWAQVLMHDVQRAVEVAKDGMPQLEVDYLLDPTPEQCLKWIEEFERYYAENPTLYLSTDIETEGKDADEEALDLEEGEFAPPIRCGYSYRKGHALSLPWGGMYQQFHWRLLASTCSKLFWNAPFDVPRLLSTGAEIGGTIHDGMDAWHVLNSDLNKGLGFVTPFFYHGFPMWKHSSKEQPAWYNAADCDTAGENMRGTVAQLKKYGMWHVYQEYIQELDPVYSAMTRAGMPVDLYRRSESAKVLLNARTKIRSKIEEIIPTEIKPRQPKAGYVREPEDKTGLCEFVFEGIEVYKCSNCGTHSPTKAHFKSRTRTVCVVCRGKWTKAHIKPKRVGNVCEEAASQVHEDNPCVEATTVTELQGLKRWAKILPFVPSTKNILTYQDYRKHKRIEVGKGEEKKATTDVKAIKKLIGQYPEDPFYRLVLEDREVTKIAGTYVGIWDPINEKVEKGMPIGRDGRVHGVFRHTPSTLRSSMVSPNLQNLPRGNDKEKQFQRLVKDMFVAPPGYTFIENDFSGIEAVLVGYRANDAAYYRLAKIDVHSYFTAHRLYDQKIITVADLPDLKWSDKDIHAWGKELKKKFGPERDIGKRCIHAGNYRVGPKKLHEEYPLWFNRPKDAKRALDLYYEVFPSIDNWHERLCKEVDKTCVTKNSFGHVHRFYHVLAWEKVGNKWEWSYSDDSKRLIAFGPQSDAAFVGKRATKRLYYDYPDSMAKWLRLFIHDALLCEVPKERAEEALSILKFEMEKPIEQMPLDPTWGFGQYVTVNTEHKVGECWGEMKG